MKICICGKGGSGKSTLVALLAGAFARSGKNVIVLDSDESNTSLFWLLGLDEAPRPLMEIVGGKKAVQQKMLDRFAKGQEEPAMSIWTLTHMASSEIPEAFFVAGEACKLVVTGKIYQSMEGCACPMGAVTREFLKILQLSPDEVALIDMEAGIEHFGRGIEANVDMVIAVAEPSLESAELAKKVMDLSVSSGAAFGGVVINKIADAEQREHLRHRLSLLSLPVIGIIDHDASIQTAALEGKPCPETAVDELDRIAATLMIDSRG
ncbi:P-loop NTPase [uncultured Desulfosarcina sp.]|uniref:ATP-binding protein n=1 Tax=uncultured Desulfosarcina sp. TaxID=218289 RepID=UPI0029C98A65|nr:P-loop NTPase [uncultured Desulfosarcina sp.]